MRHRTSPRPSCVEMLEQRVLFSHPGGSDPVVLPDAASKMNDKGSQAIEARASKTPSQAKALHAIKRIGA